MPGKSIENQPEEIWIVKLTSKGECILNRKQADILMRAILEKERGVMFKTFFIPIPYIVEFYKLPFRRRMELGVQDNRAWEEKEVDRLLG